MSTESVDMSETIAPNSDQIGAEDLLAGPREVTITGVSRGSAEQPVNITLAEFDRPYRPCKTMRRVLVAAWGAQASEYIGRRMVLFRDDRVRFGGQDVGGIRISALSHIPSRLSLAVTVTRGKRAPYTVDPLPDAPTAAAPKSLDERIAAMISAFAGVGVSEAQLVAKLGVPRSDWTADDLGVLAEVGRQIKAGEVEASVEFPETV